MKKLLNNKKLLAGIIILIIVLIVGIIFFSTREVVIDSKDELYEAIDNTLKLNSFKLSKSDEFARISQEVLVERNTEVGNIELVKYCDYETKSCDRGDKYTIAGFDVLDDDDMVYDNNDDRYHYYYKYGEVLFEIPGDDELVNKFLKKLKTYYYTKKNNEYTLKLEKNEDEEFNLLLRYFMLFYLYDDVNTDLKITLKNGYINTIKIPFVYESEIDESRSVCYLEITLEDYNNVNIKIPEKMKKSLARNYYNFVNYGFNLPASCDDSNGNCNGIKTYNDVTNVCSNGDSKISLNAGAGDDYVYQVYFNISDCNGNEEKKELYIKNTSEDFNPLSDHKNDVYNLYDKETKELIGKLTYDGKNTMKIFDSQFYDGDYVNNDD